MLTYHCSAAAILFTAFSHARSNPVLSLSLSLLVGLVGTVTSSNPPAWLRRACVLCLRGMRRVRVGGRGRLRVR